MTHRGLGLLLGHVLYEREGFDLSGVYTAADADLLWVGQELDDYAGRGLAVGDFDGSGRGDIAIGAPFALGAAEDAGGEVYLLFDPL